MFDQIIFILKLTHSSLYEPKENITSIETDENFLKKEANVKY